MIHLPIKMGIPSQYDEPKPERSPRFWRRAFMGLSFIHILYALILGINLLAVTVFGSQFFAARPCSNFESQAAAQKAYNDNPVKYSRLDGNDHDKIVCENLR